MEHREILRREFDRIAKFTDEAYVDAIEGPAKKMADYRDWATLLLRYHDAIERVTGKEPSVPPRSMKGDSVSVSRHTGGAQGLPEGREGVQSPVSDGRPENAPGK